MNHGAVHPRSLYGAKTRPV